MAYSMPKSPKGSEHLYFNGVDRKKDLSLGRCKIDCVFMVYLGCEDEDILS